MFMIAIPMEKRHYFEDPVDEYLSIIKETPTLSHEEEINLMLRIKAGDESVREHFIRANFGLVFSIAKKYNNRGIGMEELVSAGNEGLIKAVNGYETQHGTRFSTYAVPSIRQCMIQAFRSREVYARVPPEVRRFERSRARIHDQLRFTLERAPSDEEMADAMNISLRMYRQRMIDVPNAFKNRTPRQKHVVLRGESAMMPEHWDDDDGMSNPEMRDRFRDYLESLDPVEIQILTLRCVQQENGKRLSLEEVGEVVDLSPGTVDQYEKRARRKLEQMAMNDPSIGEEMSTH